MGHAFPKGLPRLPGRSIQPPLALRALLLALELLASSIRYNGGTWLEVQSSEEMPGWVKHMEFTRRNNGFSQLQAKQALEGGKDYIQLPDGFRLDPVRLKLYEPA